MMSFSLSLGGSPDWRGELWNEVYDRAKALGKVVSTTLGDWQFEYALVNSLDRYRGTQNNQFWVRDDEKNGATGINVSQKAFVFEKNVPAAFRNFVGLHEHLECFLGADAHTEACFVELSEVRKCSPETYKSYTAWLLSLTQESLRTGGIERLKLGYFCRAVPEFVQLLSDSPTGSPSDIVELFFHKVTDKLSLAASRDPLAWIKERVIQQRDNQ